MKKRMLLWFVLANATIAMSAFTCTSIQSHKELADVRIGFPVPFLSVNLQRYTPLFFPEDFCGPGSPWEDPQRILLIPLLVNYVLLFAVFYGVWMLFSLRKH